MSRNYSDSALKGFVSNLDDNERAGLKFGMLPAEPFMNMEPVLLGGDVAYMMRQLPEHF